MNAEKLQHWADPRLILVATNLADESVLAYQATSQARETGATILLVHVLRPPSLQAKLNPGPDSLITTSRRAAAWDALLRMAKMVEWQGALCEPMLLEGEPLEQIPRLVTKRAVDRVLVATRSSRGMERLLAGSVAETLMNAVEVPVCVIGPRVAANPFRGTTGGGILLALSLHHERADCAEFAFLLAARRRSSLTLMHVVDATSMSPPDRETARAIAHASVVHLASSVPGPLPALQISIREGLPAQAILDEDACPGCDFIVMGSSSPGVVSKFLGSSVVHRVIAGARAPVITIRPSSLRKRERIQDAAEFPLLERQESGVSRLAQSLYRSGLCRG